jgi:transposase
MAGTGGGVSKRFETGGGYMIYIGVDVGKDELVTALTNREGNISGKPKSFPNNLGGFKRIQKWAKRIGKEMSVDAFHLCMEATGIYGEKLAFYFYREDGFTVSVINPAQIHSFARATLKRTKTDKVDAELIAVYAAIQKPGAWEPEPENILHIRQLVRRHDALKTSLTKETNRLKQLQKCQWPRKEVVASIKRQVGALKREIAALSSACEELVNADPVLKENHGLILSIKGIGKLSAFKLLAEMGGAVQKRKAKQIAAHSGLTPREHSSGSSVRGKARISKVGNKFLRTALYMPALVAIRHNPPIKAFYERLLEVGKPKKVALVACMRKLLYIVYGVLKNKTAFDPNFHLRTA